MNLFPYSFLKYKYILHLKNWHLMHSHKMWSIFFEILKDTMCQNWIIAITKITHSNKFIIHILNLNLNHLFLIERSQMSADYGPYVNIVHHFTLVHGHWETKECEEGIRTHTVSMRSKRGVSNIFITKQLEVS
jgi:hypothetical protein